MTARYDDADGPFVVPHRAGAGMATENTADAAAASVALGHRWLETDARTTRDGVVVAFHDRTLDRVAGVPGTLADLTWADLRTLELPGGGRVARLDDLLTTWPHVRWAVDVKDPATLPALLATLRSTGAAPRVCLAGTWDRWLDVARAQLGADVRTALGWASTARLLAGAPWRPTSHAPTFVHLPWALVRRRGPAWVVRRSRAWDLRPVVWGVEDATAMHALLDAGVDGLIGDRADTLREVMLARGCWTPVRRAGLDPAAGRQAV
ncbi:glycerophosphodiester phosphodiesterase family protein [Cellulomonas phragmiteti]|uniref:GP-PDE domain-containing protein n=1 Tax=Cellulomonas phragmiteti TaxID=478780 RepID=A0ABQ4DH57_9CELL|nr:glycerophosphodiester phosphodiesterase family protein [Cellulomonas phragmiteti]GIG38362.1 hypothetical protein Cph01nite_01240 [Cellulomonas phragmiteti]